MNPNRKVQPTVFNGFTLILTLILVIVAAAFLSTQTGQNTLKDTLPKSTDFTKITKPTPINTTANFLTYRAENFEIQYPAGYLIDEMENSTTKLQIYAATPGKLAQVFQVMEYENTNTNDATTDVLSAIKQTNDVYNQPTQTEQVNTHKQKYTLISTSTKVLDQPDVLNEQMHLNWAIYQCQDLVYLIQTAIPQSQSKDKTTAQYVIDSFTCTQ